MTPAEFGSFVVVSAVLAWVPGPTVALIAASSLRGGFQAGLAAVVGTQLGYLIWLAVGVFALGLVTADSTWIVSLRWAGAAYLAWLAFRLYRSRGSFSKAAASLADNPWIQGFMVILVNPKMLVLFGSLIPSYVAGPVASGFEVLWLGLIFMLIATFGDLIYAYAFDRFRSLVSVRNERWLEAGGALCLLAGGIYLVVRNLMA